MVVTFTRFWTAVKWERRYTSVHMLNPSLDQHSERGAEWLFLIGKSFTLSVIFLCLMLCGDR